MTLLHLDIDVIIIILKKIKEQQVMPRLMWSLSASSLVVRRQLATRPHDHLQLYIFFSIATRTHSSSFFIFAYHGIVNGESLLVALEGSTLFCDGIGWIFAFCVPNIRLRISIRCFRNEWQKFSISNKLVANTKKWHDSLDLRWRKILTWFAGA